MVYIQNRWVFGLCPTSNILESEKARNTAFRKLNLLQSSGEAQEGECGVTEPTQLCPLERGPVIDASSV
jgi:hypothetical protein